MVKPIRKQILFKPFMGEAITAGGLIIPDNCRKLSDRGEIMAIGNMVSKVKVGDIAFRVQAWGLELIEGEEKYYLMDEDAILATD